MLNWVGFKVPTGAGKARLMAKAIDEIRKHRPESQIVYLTPFNSLRDQFMKELGSNPHGVVGMSFQSYHKNPSLYPRDVLIMDEVRGVLADKLNRALFNKPVYVVEFSSH